MIGYYADHEGRDHLGRILALASALDEPVTVLSSHSRPPEAPPHWVELPFEQENPRADGSPRRRGDYHGHLDVVARWLHQHRPRVLVVDASVARDVNVTVEVTALAEQLSVPVVTVLAPGRRDDPSQRRGFELSQALVAPWPRSAEPLVDGLGVDDEDRVHYTGAISRLSVGTARPFAERGRRVLVLDPDDAVIDDEQIAAARATSFGWSWTIARHGVWHRDTQRLLDGSDAVICHAGQDVIAEVAARRRPAVVIPRPRPLDEQGCLAASLERGPWPAVVRSTFPRMARTPRGCARSRRRCLGVVVRRIGGPSLRRDAAGRPRGLKRTPPVAGPLDSALDGWHARPIAVPHPPRVRLHALAP